VRNILSSGLRTIELLRPGDAGGAEGATPVRDRMAATQLLRSFARDPLNMGVLRRSLAAELGTQRVARMVDKEVVDHLARHVAGGRMQVASLAASRAAVPRRSLVWERPFAGSLTKDKGGAKETGATGGGAATAASDTTPSTASWIRFRVIDDATDQPVAGVTLTLTLPDGKTQDVTSGDDGMIEVKGLVSGTCDIQKMSDSEAWEVVQIG
jgi:hypothetical protein